MMDENANNIYSILLKKKHETIQRRKISTSNKWNIATTKVEEDLGLHSHFGTRFLPLELDARQKSKRGLNSYIPMLATLKEPELTAMNLKGNKFFMDLM